MRIACGILTANTRQEFATTDANRKLFRVQGSVPNPSD
jgi:hypothetical protein